MVYVMNETLVHALTVAASTLSAPPGMDDYLMRLMAGVGTVLVLYHAMTGLFGIGSAVAARVRAPQESAQTERDHAQAENEYLQQTIAELSAKLGLPSPPQTVTLQIEHPKPGGA